MGISINSLLSKDGMKDLNPINQSNRERKFSEEEAQMMDIVYFLLLLQLKCALIKE